MKVLLCSVYLHVIGHSPGEQSITVHAGWDEEEDQIKVTPPLPPGDPDEGVDK